MTPRSEAELCRSILERIFEIDHLIFAGQERFDDLAIDETSAAWHENPDCSFPISDVRSR